MTGFKSMFRNWNFVKLLDELIRVIDVFSMIWVIRSDLTCLYVLRNNSLEGMVDKLKL